jgi:hypothetical protein
VMAKNHRRLARLWKEFRHPRVDMAMLGVIGLTTRNRSVEYATFVFRFTLQCRNAWKIGIVVWLGDTRGTGYHEGNVPITINRRRLIDGET